MVSLGLAESLCASSDPAVTQRYYDYIQQCKSAIFTTVLLVLTKMNRPFNVRYAVNATTLPSTVPGGKPIYVPAGIR